jgi:hypothetical protein
MTTLSDIAFARAGDKGDSSIIMIAPYRPEDLDRLREALTADRIAEHVDLAPESVTVRFHDHLAAATIVLAGRLAGGVTRSPTTDPHGKTLSGHLLDLPLT